MDFSLQLIDQSNRDQTIHAETKISHMSLKKVPAGIYLSQVNNGNTRTMYETCSKLTIKTPVFIVNSEQISNIALAFPLLTLNK